jgi:uncharacterized alpha-E superfamily protein
MLVRDRTSNDMWRVLSQIGDRLATPPAENIVMLAGDAVGIAQPDVAWPGGVPRAGARKHDPGAGWRFLDIGCALNARSILHAARRDACARPKRKIPACWKPCLKWWTARITFRSRYNLMPTVPAVFDLVLLDDTNPRSVLFQINQLVKHFEKLPRERESDTRRQSHFARLQLAAALPRPARTCRDEKSGLKAPRPRDPRDVARAAAHVRRHRRELFCALGNFPHRDADLSHELTTSFIARFTSTPRR